MRNRVGPPVEGDDFVGKVKELELAWEMLSEGNSLLLAAPRRVGKTSFAKKLIERANKESWRTLSLNLEGIKTEQVFIVTFINELKRTTWFGKLSHKFTKSIDDLLNSIDISVEINEIKTNIAWNSKKENFFKELENLFEHNEETLIFVDELGVFLNKYEKPKNIQGAEFFLNWFRSIRQISKTKIRWVFCSSIGVRNFTSRHQISYTINDVEPFVIDAFDKETAKQLVNNLAVSKGVHISDEISTLMLKQLEWYLPYFIQLLFKEIYALQFQFDIEIDETLVYKAFDNIAKNSNLDTWDERLNYYYQKEETARKVLTHLAENKEFRKRSQLFDLIHDIKNSKEYTTDFLGDTLRLLINDGYLMQNEAGLFSFRSPLLKKYWYNKFIK